MALNTPEKDNLIQQYQMANQKPIRLTKSERNVMEFAQAIRNRDFHFFATIVDENRFDLRDEIFSDLQNDIFRVDNLLPTFKTLFNSRSFSTNSELLRELQKVDLDLFCTQNIVSYKIDNELRDYIKLQSFYHSYRYYNA